MDKQLLSYILRAKSRRNILNLLLKETLTPIQLIKKTNLYMSHVSRCLKELSDKNLIICDNPEERRYKFYSITTEGKKINKIVQKILKDAK